MVQEWPPQKMMYRFLFGTVAGLEEDFSFKIADARAEDLKVRFSWVLRPICSTASFCHAGVVNIVHIVVDRGRAPPWDAGAGAHLYSRPRHHSARCDVLIYRNICATLGTVSGLAGPFHALSTQSCGFGSAETNDAPLAPP